MGLLGNLLKGSQVDMDKSNANREKIHAMFDRTVDNGVNYSILLYRRYWTIQLRHCSWQ